MDTKTIITGAALVAAIGLGYLWWQCKNQPAAQPPATQWFRPNQ